MLMKSMGLASNQLASRAHSSGACVLPPHTFDDEPLSAACAVRRAADIMLSAVVLCLAAPLLGLIAALIRLDSPGPALFRQLRVGQHGRLFTFFKFRTMYVDARERFPELYAYRYSEAQLGDLYFKLPDDPRLTRVGRWLRKSTLDELPNFVNVLLGHMALVGPRPEIPEMVGYYRTDQLQKFAYKPGVTGLAQISGRARLRFRETIECDLQYCRRRSLSVDLWILVMTIKAVVLQVGAF
jgi:lipopolysaccharide/colanic/teichoic acid biosynthesis glycosyltransferase